MPNNAWSQLFYARLKGVPPLLEHEHVRQALDDVGLYDVRHRHAGRLSGGMRRRLRWVSKRAQALGACAADSACCRDSLAISLVGDSALTLLDEPTTGLDPASRRQVRRRRRLLHLRCSRKGGGADLEHHRARSPPPCHLALYSCHGRGAHRSAASPVSVWRPPQSPNPAAGRAAVHTNWHHGRRTASLLGHSAGALCHRMHHESHGHLAHTRLVQHLKEKYGGGYLLSVNFAAEDEARVRAFVHAQWPDATVSVAFQCVSTTWQLCVRAAHCCLPGSGYIAFQLPARRGSVAEVFSTMCKSAQAQGVTDWGVGQVRHCARVCPRARCCRAPVTHMLCVHGVCRALG